MTITISFSSFVLLFHPATEIYEVFEPIIPFVNEKFVEGNLLSVYEGGWGESLIISKENFQQCRKKPHFSREKSSMKMSAPSKAKQIKLDNPAQGKVSHHFGTKLHRLGGNK